MLLGQGDFRKDYFPFLLCQLLFSVPFKYLHGLLQGQVEGSKIGALNLLQLFFLLHPTWNARFIAGSATSQMRQGQQDRPLRCSLRNFPQGSRQDAAGFTSHERFRTDDGHEHGHNPTPRPAARCGRTPPSHPWERRREGAREMAAASAGGRRSPAAPPHRAAPPGSSGPCHVPLTTPAPTHSRPSNRPRRGSAAPPAGRAAGTAPRPS